MARVALAVGGAVAGFLIGGPAGAQWGLMAGNVLGSLVPQNVRGPSIEEGATQTTAEGAPRAIIFGTAMVSGNVIDAGKTRKVTRKQRQGKGGQSVTTEALLRTYAVRICEGPIGGLLMVKKDGKIVYDIRPDANFAEDSARFLQGCRVYLGDGGQLPDPDLESIRGIGEVPAYRGSAYVVFVDDDVTDRRGSIPQYEFVLSKGPIEEETKTATSIGQNLGGVHFLGGVELESHVRITSDDFGNSTCVLLFIRHLVVSWASGSADANITVLCGGESFIVATTFPTGFDWANNRQGYTLLQVNKLNPGSVIDLSYKIVKPPDNYNPEMTFNMNVEVYTPGSLELYREASDSPMIDWKDRLFGIFEPRIEGDVEKYFYANEDWWGKPVFNSGGWQGVNSGGIELSKIVDDIHARCKSQQDSWDSSELTDFVHGLVLASAGYSGADAINTLRAPYFFDRTEWGGKVRYIKRGKPSFLTITQDHLVDEPDESRREDQIEYPRKFHLTYQSAAVNYESAQSTSDRSSPDVRVTGEAAMQVPVVLTPELAATKAAILHKTSWAEAAGDVKFSVPDSFIRIVPTDCILLNIRNSSRRLRIENVENAAGVIQITGRVDRQSAYGSTAGYVPLPTPTPPVTGVVGPTELAVLDIPALRDNDDALLYYAVVSGSSTAWRGALLQISLNSGASYSDVVEMDFSATMGRLAAPLGAASPWYTDRTNIIDVEISRESDVLEISTDVEFLSRGGAIALRFDDGTWEVAQFRDAEHVAGTRWRLSTLHRGQLATPSGSHPVGSRFVLLEDVTRLSAESAWLQAVLTHRAPSFGATQESAPAQSMSYAGNAQREWPVASLVAAVDAGTLTASWAPRHRFGTDVAPLASLNFQGFRVSISDGVAAIGFDTLEAAVTRDVSGLSMPITISVAALNRITGPGPTTTRTVTA